MKKILLSVILVFAPSVIHAFGSQGTTSNYPVKLWRSSQTCTAINNTPFSSGTVVIHAVLVTSPTVNVQPSFFALTNSVGTAFNMAATTITFIETNVTSKSEGVAPYANIQDVARVVPFDIQITSYTTINKSGGACTNLLWDWLDATRANPTPR